MGPHLWKNTSFRKKINSGKNKNNLIALAFFSQLLSLIRKQGIRFIPTVPIYILKHFMLISCTGLVMMHFGICMERLLKYPVGLETHLVPLAKELLPSLTVCHQIHVVKRVLNFDKTKKFNYDDDRETMGRPYLMSQDNWTLANSLFKYVIQCSDLKVYTVQCTSICLSLFGQS